MPDLDYGYEVTVQTPAASNPEASSVTNQWQRQTSGNTNWEGIGGASGETYEIAPEDRSAKIRLQQDLNGAKAYSNELQVTGKEFDSSAGLDEFGELDSSLDKWTGGVLAPNGKIYAMPWNYASPLEIDPVARTAAPFGSTSFVSEAKYGGGCLGSDGKIYAPPHNTLDYLKINPSNRTVTEIYLDVGHLGNRWWGGVKGLDDQIYGIPHNNNFGVWLNTSTQKTFSVRLPFPEQTGKWTGGVLAPNGKIYGIPNNASGILEIDPSLISSGNPASAYKTFGNFDSFGIEKWQGGVLAPDGKIYCIPFRAGTILEIDPINQTTSTWGAVNGNFSGGVLAPNGKIYAIPYNALTLLEIDPVNKQTRKFGAFNEYFKWRGGVLGVDGVIYGIPFRSKTVLTIDLGFSPATGSSGSENWSLVGLPGDILDPRSPYFNKF